MKSFFSGQTTESKIVTDRGFEDLRFLLINTKKIFEISKEFERKMEIFKKLMQEEEKDGRVG